MADDRVILFDSASTNNDSPVFKIDQQRTIIAVGMQPGDYITFEVVRIEPGKGAQVCGCRLIEGTNALINGTQELLCPTCESEEEQPVRLTWRNPVVVLDSPQDSYLRAIYQNDEGESGIDLGTVTVWAIETDTPDLTDAMRGCPPICCEDEEEEWFPDGIHRCTDENVEVLEVSNCGNKRWTVCGPVVWTDTGQIRCLEETTEVEQTNQCGQRRWVEGEPIEWTATGITQCIDNTLRIQESNQCGDIRWQETEEVCGQIVVETDSCLTGDGSVENPLGLDEECLRDNIVNVDEITIIGDGSEEDPLQVQLSDDDGNLLEVRGDGLYYGIEPPPDLANLYVSTSLGDDTNSGSRDAPLATVDEALSRHINNSVQYRVHLRSGEVFTYSGARNLDIARVVFLTYDEPTYQDLPDQGVCFGYTPYLADEFVRATLQFTPRQSGTDPDGNPIYEMSRLMYDLFIFQAVNIAVANPGAVDISGGQYVLHALSSITFQGLNFDTGAGDSDQALVSRVRSSYIQLVTTEKTGDAPLILGNRDLPSISHRILSGTTDGCGVYPAYTRAPDNIETIPLEELISNPVHDVSTKSQFSYRTEWDPWA